MSRQDPAGVHFFSFWAARAGDETLPVWLRLAALAYSSHHKNGHACFLSDGETVLPKMLNKTRRHVLNEIKTAISKGFLTEGSNANCLIVPDDITGGAEGNAYAACQLHRR